MSRIRSQGLFSARPRTDTPSDVFDYTPVTGGDKLSASGLGSQPPLQLTRFVRYTPFGNGVVLHLQGALARSLPFLAYKNAAAATKSVERKSRVKVSGPWTHLYSWLRLLDRRRRVRLPIGSFEPQDIACLIAIGRHEVPAVRGEGDRVELPWQGQRLPNSTADDIAN